MDSEQQHLPEDAADAAERAFEALRDEVAALRRALERLAQGRSSDEPAPDYSPTLGAMAQELRAVGARLDGIEAQPALRLTPAEITRQVAAGVRQASEDAARGHAHAGSRLDDAVRDMQTLIGSANSQLAQRRRCRRDLCGDSVRRRLRSGEDIGSSGEVNALRDERLGKRLPTVDLAHVDLARGE